MTDFKRNSISESFVGRMSFAQFVILIFFVGNFLIGAMNAAFLETVSHFNLPDSLRYVSLTIVLIFIAFSILATRHKAKFLPARQKKAANFLLTTYVGTSVLTFLLIGDVSPLTFAGKMSFRAVL